MPLPGRILALVLYVAMLAGVTAGMFYARDVAAPQLATQQGQADWNTWRREATGKGPVARREPKSIEPPLVVLMRDYFAVCLTGAILFSSLLFAVLAFVVRGIATTPTATPTPGMAKRPPNR
ncbi:MAG: hypothetical protein WD875_07400 [Pirellulales bacterium]